MHPQPCRWEKYIYTSLILEWIFNTGWMSQLINRLALVHCFSLSKQCFFFPDWFNISGSNQLSITQSDSLGMHYFVGICYFGRKVSVWSLPLPPECGGSSSERGRLRTVLSPLGLSWRSLLPLISFLGHAPKIECLDYCYVHFFFLDCICKSST